MEFLPSEIARLVLGYLQEQNCQQAFDAFLRACPHLTECRETHYKGLKFRTEIAGLDLVGYLQEYSNISLLLSNYLKKYSSESASKLRRCGTVLEQLKFLLEAQGGSQTMLLSISLPPEEENTSSTICRDNKNSTTDKESKRKLQNCSTSLDCSSCSRDEISLEATTAGSLPGYMSSTPKKTTPVIKKTQENDEAIVNSTMSTLLENRSFHEKLADTINKVITNSSKKEEVTQHVASQKVELELDQAIKKIIQRTEDDPSFSQLIEDIAGPIVSLDGDADKQLVPEAKLENLSKTKDISKIIDELKSNTMPSALLSQETEMEVDAPLNPIFDKSISNDFNVPKIVAMETFPPESEDISRFATRSIGPELQLVQQSISSDVILLQDASGKTMVLEKNGSLVGYNETLGLNQQPLADMVLQPKKKMGRPKKIKTPKNKKANRPILPQSEPIISKVTVTLPLDALGTLSCPPLDAILKKAPSTEACPENDPGANIETEPFPIPVTTPPSPNTSLEAEPEVSSLPYLLENSPCKPAVTKSPLPKLLGDWNDVHGVGAIVQQQEPEKKTRKRPPSSGRQLRAKASPKAKIAIKIGPKRKLSPKKGSTSSSPKRRRRSVATSETKRRWADVPDGSKQEPEQEAALAAEAVEVPQEAADEELDPFGGRIINRGRKRSYRKKCNMGPPPLQTVVHVEEVKFLDVDVVASEDDIFTGGGLLLESAQMAQTPCPKEPSLLNPDTPFTKLLKENGVDVDIASILTPSLAFTPCVALSPIDGGANSVQSCGSRPTDYSTSSSYYQPSDSEHTLALEKVLMQELKASEEQLRPQKKPPPDLGQVVPVPLRKGGKRLEDIPRKTQSSSSSRSSTEDEDEDYADARQTPVGLIEHCIRFSQRLRNNAEKSKATSDSVASEEPAVGATQVLGSGTSLKKDQVNIPAVVESKAKPLKQTVSRKPAISQKKMELFGDLSTEDDSTEMDTSHEKSPKKSVEPLDKSSKPPAKRQELLKTGLNPPKKSEELVPVAGPSGLKPVRKTNPKGVEKRVAKANPSKLKNISKLSSESNEEPTEATTAKIVNNPKTDAAPLLLEKTDQKPGPKTEGTQTSIAPERVAVPESVDAGQPDKAFLELQKNQPKPASIGESLKSQPEQSISEEVAKGKAAKQPSKEGDKKNEDTIRPAIDPGKKHWKAQKTLQRSLSSTVERLSNILGNAKADKPGPTSKTAKPASNDEVEGTIKKGESSKPCRTAFVLTQVAHKRKPQKEVVQKYPSKLVQSDTNREEPTVQHQQDCVSKPVESGSSREKPARTSVDNTPGSGSGREEPMKASQTCLSKPVESSSGREESIKALQTVTSKTAGSSKEIDKPTASSQVLLSKSVESKSNKKEPVKSSKLLLSKSVESKSNKKEPVKSSQTSANKAAEAGSKIGEPVKSSETPVSETSKAAVIQRKEPVMLSLTALSQALEGPTKTGEPIKSSETIVGKIIKAAGIQRKGPVVLSETALSQTLQGPTKIGEQVKSSEAPLSKKVETGTFKEGSKASLNKANEQRSITLQKIHVEPGATNAVDLPRKALEKTKDVAKKLSVAESEKKKITERQQNDLRPVEAEREKRGTTKPSEHPAKILSVSITPFDLSGNSKEKSKIPTESIIQPTGLVKDLPTHEKLQEERIPLLKESTPENPFGEVLDACHSNSSKTSEQDEFPELHLSSSSNDADSASPRADCAPKPQFQRVDCTESMIRSLKERGIHLVPIITKNAPPLDRSLEDGECPDEPPEPHVWSNASSSGWPRSREPQGSWRGRRGRGRWGQSRPPTNRYMEEGQRPYGRSRSPGRSWRRSGSQSPQFHHGHRRSFDGHASRSRGSFHPFGRESKSPSRTSKSPRASRSPRPLSRSSGRVCKTPERTRKTPESTRKTPERTRKTPERTRKTPERTRKTPERTRKTPERTRKTPERTRKTPERARKTPERTRKTPERTRKTPERTRKTPERTRKSPERSRKSPKTTSRSSGRICKSPDRTLKSPRTSSRSSGKISKSPKKSLRGGPHTPPGDPPPDTKTKISMSDYSRRKDQENDNLMDFVVTGADTEKASSAASSSSVGRRSLIKQLDLGNFLARVHATKGKK